MWEPEVLKVHEFFTEPLSMEGKYAVKLSITEHGQIMKHRNCLDPTAADVETTHRDPDRRELLWLIDEERFFKNATIF